MMEEKIKIVFDKRIFIAGQPLTGKVCLNLTEETKYRGLRIRVTGISQVSWTESVTEGTGQNQRTVQVTYSASEDYLNIVMTLTGPSGSSQRHPMGYKEYPFRVQLPSNLPSTFRGGQYGFVRYTAKATFDRPFKFDYEAKRTFCVQSVLDLNTCCNAATPQQASDQKTICCLCCASGPILVNLELPKTGFVPGEYIPLRGEINNNSSSELKLKAQLFQTARYYAENRSKEGSPRAIWSSAELPNVDPLQTYLLDEYRKIPSPLATTDLAGCNIIDIKYKLTFTISPDGPSFKFKLTMPVLIGTVPLRDNFITPPNAQADEPSGSESGSEENTGNGSGSEDGVQPVPSAPVFTQPTPVSPGFGQPIGPPYPVVTPYPCPYPVEPPPPTYSECGFGTTSSREKTDSDNMKREDGSSPPFYPLPGAMGMPQPSAPPPGQ